LLLAFLAIESSLATQFFLAGMKGCYINNREQHEFNEFAGHLDPATLTPKRCMKACSSMGFNLAAIEEGKWCFCKSGTISSSLAADTNCQTVLCQGDSSFFCGAQDFLLVYGTESTSVIHVKQHLDFLIASLNK
jgi:hypothetical protein